MNLESNFNATFKKFSYKIFQFSKIRKYLPPDVRVLVYKQTVLPMVEYISYLLYINRKHDVDKLQKLQNRALRLCFDIIDPMSVSVCQLHTQAQIGMLEPRRDVQLLGLLYDMRSDTRYLRDTIINTRLADRIVFSVDRVNYEYIDGRHIMLGINCGTIWIWMYRCRELSLCLNQESSYLTDTCTQYLK